MAEGVYTLEATYYRTALLLGLVDERVVHRWAEQAIERESQPAEAFFDIVSVNAGDLSGLRNALWPLVTDPEPVLVIENILGLLYADLKANRRELQDTL